MTSSNATEDERVAMVAVDDTTLRVQLRNGEWLSAPLADFPRLAAGTPEQRAGWVVAGAGFSIHWPELDEDISVESIRHPEAYPLLAQPTARVAEPTDVDSEGCL